MRDAAKSGGAFPESIRKALTKNNSRMYNILIILIFISLTALAGYLAYDILSNRSVGAFDSSSSSLQGKGSIAVIDGWQEKGMKLLAQGKYNESIACFDKAISEKPSNPIAWKYKGNALYALGNYENATICYDKALLLNSSEGEALYNKGRALFAMKRYDDARAAFGRAEKLGKWPNPMRSMNSSNTTSSQPVSNKALGGSRIIVDWARANSEEHSSSGDSPHYSPAAAKASTNDKAVSHIGSSETHKDTASNASMNTTNVNITTLNITEISASLTGNTSTGTSIKATENGRSAKIKAKRVESKARILPAKKLMLAPKKPIAPKARVEKTSAAKAALASSKPNVAVKKSVRTPRAPSAPKAPAAKPKTARTPIKK